MSSAPDRAARVAMARISRRGFLGLSGSAGLSVLAGLPSLPARAEASTAPGAFFSAGEREILTTIVERMVETGEPKAPAVRDTRAIEVIDEACAALPGDVTGLLPVALQLFEWWPFLFELRFTRFSELPPDARDASLRGWMESRIATRRLAFYALRNLALLGYWSQDETWPLVGYAGPLLDRARSSP